MILLRHCFSSWPTSQVCSQILATATCCKLNTTASNNVDGHTQPSCCCCCRKRKKRRTIHTSSTSISSLESISQQHTKRHSNADQRINRYSTLDQTTRPTSNYHEMASSPLLSRILANSVAMTNKAAMIARDIMASGDLGIEQKTDINDLQTKADRSIQDCIASSLRASFPGIAIVGEEGEDLHGEVPADWIIKEQDKEAATMKIPDEFKETPLEDFTIWIDPLDGTKEYTEGFLDHVTILVGIAIGDKAIAGVINQPFFNFEKKGAEMGRTLYGIVGSGVRGIERVLPPAGARIVTTTRSHGTGLVNDCANICKPTDIIRVGGAGHKVMLLIEGKANAYVFPSPGCKKWDTCAPEAILHALGGKLTDIHGNFYKYKMGVGKPNEHGTLATCVLEQHEEYLNLIPQEMKDQVKDYFKNKSKK